SFQKRSNKSFRFSSRQHVIEDDLVRLTNSKSPLIRGKGQAVNLLLVGRDRSPACGLRNHFFASDRSIVDPASQELQFIDGQRGDLQIVGEWGHGRFFDTGRNSIK